MPVRRAMSPVVFPVFAAVCAIAMRASAQGVPAAGEPHHHPVYEDAQFRVLRVEVPPHDSTQLHRHETDYFWIAVEAADVVSAVLGQGESRTVASANSLHFSKGPFSHVAHNSLAEPFRNVTIELLFPQANPKNLCEHVLPALPLNCPDSAHAGSGSGAATVLPSFTTDQLRVALATLRGGGTLDGTSSRAGTLMIAAEESSAAALSVTSLGRPLAWTRGVVRLEGGTRFQVHNSGSEPCSVVVAGVR